MLAAPRRRPTAPMEEMVGDRRAGEEAVCSGIGGGSAGGEPLHPLQVEAVLLQMAGDVLPGEAVDAHQLHDRLGDGVLDAEVGHGVDEALVELWGPHEAWPLQGPSGLVLAGRVGELGGGGGRWVGGRRGRGTTIWGDVEGQGEVLWDEVLGQRG